MRPCAFRPQGAVTRTRQRDSSAHDYFITDVDATERRLPGIRHGGREEDASMLLAPTAISGIYTETNASRTLMRAKRKLWVLSLTLAVQLTFASAANAKDIVAFAAASLKNALDEASAAYQREAESRVLISYASSSTLAKQIENGAPADLFIS